jgi:hypothetical protein
MTTGYKKWTIHTLQHRRQLDDYWVQEVDTSYSGRDKLMVCVFIKHYLQLGECGGYFKLSFIHTHGHCHYISHLFHNVSPYDTLVELLYIQKPLGVHHIHTKLFALPHSNLYSMSNSCLENLI